MSGLKRTPALFTIPPQAPFADALARTLLAEAGGDPMVLSRVRVLLPTRRAARTLRDSFLQLSGGKPLLLPVMQPLGDVDEDELLLEGTDAGLQTLTLPAAMPPLRRRIMLARLIGKIDGFARGPAQAMTLAKELGHLMDQVYTEGLDMRTLPTLVDVEAFAAHWQTTVNFLTILSEEWPKILAEQGMIDAADRRSRLMQALAESWAEKPPAYQVIAAGSTGSIPSTRALLSTIVHMEQGRVVLPGIDLGMDDESWAALDDTHPQATLRGLLAGMHLAREDVRIWPGCEDAAKGARQRLISEVMRPAATSDKWQKLRDDEGERQELLQAARDVELHNSETPEEEARAIALIFRQTLEQPGCTAAMITPDRQLARRVAMACRRWGIEVNDTGGQALSDLPAGVFLRLAARAAISGFGPAALLSVLRHPLTHAGLGGADLARRTGQLEKTLLRGVKPPPGFTGLRAHAQILLQENAAAKKSATRQGATDKALQFLDIIEAPFAPLTRLCDGQAHEFGQWLTCHIEAAEALAASPDISGAERLWRGEDGEEAAQFLSSLMQQVGDMPPLSGSEYLAILHELMKGVTVRPRYGTHPRLSIMGQLEARMAGADVIVLAGLNEGTWPPDPGHDPWMSRPMRARFGLPSPERSIGLSAHDFAQAFCSKNVILTRAARKEGVPTVPARWLQRMDTVLQGLGEKDGIGILERGRVDWLGIARVMDKSAATQGIRRPVPTPPVERRPMELPATQIETWLADPYSIYAKYVLGLRKLEPLERAPDSAARGTFLHAVLNEFAETYRDALPADPAAAIIDIGLRLMPMQAGDAGFWEYWLPRFHRIAEFLAEHEAQWRTYARYHQGEVEGRVEIPTSAGPFTLTARADRIDRIIAGGTDGKMAIIDYKSGGNYTRAGIKSGDAPQLPLEALILNEGGFPGIQERTGYLGYWKLTGGVKKGDLQDVREPDEIDAAVEAVRGGLIALVEEFSKPETPYHATPRASHKPRFNDYAHLSRVQEWSVEDDAEDAA